MRRCGLENQPQFCWGRREEGRGSYSSDALRVVLKPTTTLVGAGREGGGKGEEGQKKKLKRK